MDAVPSPWYLYVMPGGSCPLAAIEGVGEPLVVISNVDERPRVRLSVDGLVICGAEELATVIASFWFALVA